MDARTIVSSLLLFSLFLVGETQLTEVDQLRKTFWTMEEDIFRRIGIIGTSNARPLTLDELITKFKNFDNDMSKFLLRRGKNFFETDETRLIDRAYLILKRTQRHRNWGPYTISISRHLLKRQSSLNVDVQLKKLGKFVAEQRGLRKIFKEMDADVVCTTGQSKRDMLYRHYESVAIAEIKGYALVQFSQTVLHLRNEGNFTTALYETRRKFKQQSKATADVVLDGLKSANGDVRRCDPERHILNETYVEVTNFLQGYIQNEVNLNEKGTCRESCAAYAYTKTYSCFDNEFCSKQEQCHGKVLNCRFVESNMNICLSKSKNRRYDYVKYDTGSVLGRIGRCQKKEESVMSWWRWLVWHCSYCLCICDQESNSDRYISMRAVRSNIADNRVVTGLRLVKVNEIIQLQVQEGKLMPRGTIDPNTSRWVSVENFRTGDAYKNQDYFLLSWENRAIDLDDVTVLDGYVVTGVRFRKLGAHLNFEVLATPFNFDSGKLGAISSSHWINNWKTESSNDRRTKIILNKPDIPTRVPKATVVDSKSNQFVEMTHSDFGWDAAQTTVPFFDAQPVESKVPVPLSGAGIYHKGTRNSGGFIAPKIITYDYTRNLKANDFYVE